jgi:hypothetical protein
MNALTSSDKTPVFPLIFVGIAQEREPFNRNSNFAAIIKPDKNFILCKSKISCHLKQF